MRLAADFARLHRATFSSVFWLDGRSEDRDVWMHIHNNGTSLETELGNRPNGKRNLFDDTTMVSSWIETEYGDVTANFEAYNRIINNVTIAVPHPGVYPAATDPINAILQPSDLENLGGYSIRASVVPPSLNVMCANISPSDLAPLIFRTNEETDVPGQKIGLDDRRRGILYPIAHILTQLILRQPALDPLLPNTAEALAVYASLGLVAGSMQSIFRQYWGLAGRLLRDARARRRHQRRCLAYLLLVSTREGGLVTDYTEPQNLFALVVPFRVGYAEGANHYFFEEAGPGAGGRDDRPPAGAGEKADGRDRAASDAELFGNQCRGGRYGDSYKRLSSSLSVVWS
ncbi:hypothetical protein DL771_006598 [Monosporascus sp. 5C6A]|nr:hypothetical protein DL771_006598 [Monosporascus sp. 5C6A]